MATIPIRLWNDPEPEQTMPEREFDCRVSVGIDEGGLTTPESHISVNRRWLDGLVSGNLDELMRNMGLDRTLVASGENEVLRFDLARALTIAESSLPGGGDSEDARRIRGALHGLMHGLTVVVENRVKGFMLIQEYSSKVTRVSQVGQYTGPESPEYSFHLEICRQDAARKLNA